MESEVAAFESACAALETPHRAAAQAQLEALRASPAGVPLARAVVETSRVPSAQLHALLVFRAAAVRAWPSLSPTDRAGVRDWCLTLAANRCADFTAPVLTAAVVAVAVLHKRGWLEEEPPARARLLEQIGQLFASDAARQGVGVRLCSALVQEFGSSGSSGRSTALGQSLEWHKATGSAFEASALRECFMLVSRLLISKVAGCATLPPPHTECGVITACLETMQEAVEWGVSGTGGGGASSAGTRIPLSRAWRPLLLDAQGTVVNTVARLLAVTRGRDGDDAMGQSYSRVANASRQLLALLCGLEGDVFDSCAAQGVEGCAGTHITIVVDACVELLRPSSSWVDALLLSRNTDGAAFEPAFAEATDVLLGLSAAVRVHRLLGIASVAPNSAHALLVESAGFACRVLGDMCDTASRALALAVSAASPGGGGEAALAPGRKAMARLLEGRYAAAMEAVDAAQELWVSIALELSNAERDGGPPTRANANEGAILEAVTTLARSCATTMYERLVRTRLAMGGAIMALELDDDSPFEDVSSLKDHHECAAQLARLSAAPSLSLLTTLFSDARGRLACAVSSCEGSSADVSVEASIACEELWWLVGYAGNFLCDAPEGETPQVPTSLISVCRASERAAAAAAAGGGGLVGSSAMHRDPVVALSFEVLSTLESQLQQLMMEGSTRARLSPLLSTQLLWFAARWSRSYLLPSFDHHSLHSPPRALTDAYGAEAGGLLGGGGAIQPTPWQHGDGSVAAATLCVVPVTPALFGGRGVLEFLTQAGALALSLWGGGGGEADTSAAALSLLRNLIIPEQTARYAALSPSWAALSDAVLRVISGEYGGGRAPVGGASLGAGAPWYAALRCLGALPCDAQSALLSLTLSFTRHIGAECGPAWSAACEHSTLRDSEETAGAIAASCGGGATAIVAALTSAAANGTSTLSSASVLPPPPVLAILARWAAFYTPLVAALGSRYASVLSSREYMTSPTDVRVCTEVERLLALHVGVVKAATGVPDAWHLSTTLPCLASIARLVAAAHTSGVSSAASSPADAVVMRGLRFTLEFLDVDWVLPSAAAEAAIYGAIAAIFRAYAGVGTLGRSVTRPDTASSAAAAAAENTLCGDVLLLLTILQRIADKESIDFGGGSVGGGGGGSDVNVCASDALVCGLSLLIPLMTPTLLSYPGCAEKYMELTSHILSTQPAQAARMDPSLFATLVTSLEHGMRHHDPNVAASALSAVRGMGFYHVSARKRGGAFAAMDLAHQLSAMPHLFPRLASSVLNLACGSTTPLPATLVTAAADALLACAVADPPAFHAAASDFLTRQAAASGNSIAERVAAELSALTSVTLPGVGHGAPPITGVPLSLDRPVKMAFARSFADVVARIRGVTVMF